MKKILLIMLLALTIAFSGCSTKALTIEGTEEITMANVDEFLNYDDARFIDLRNFSDQLNTGYVAGFELVSFFEYLEGRALVRNNGWEFSAADIKSKAILENIFGDKEKALLLMCGSGTRAGYVKAALDEIGYTKVINIGGMKDYAGVNKVLGDGKFNGSPVLPAEITMANIDKLMSRPGAKYVDLRNVKDKYVSGYIDGFENLSFFEYIDNNATVRNNGWEFSAADIQSKAKLMNLFGDKNREIFLMCGSGTRAGYVKASLEEIGYTNVYNVGGIKDYAGERKILGDADFEVIVK